MANEEELDRISNQMDVAQARGEAIRSQLQTLQNTLIEIGGAIEGLENLRKAKGDTLVPLGAGVFVSCPKPDPERVVMAVGAGVLVQKKPDEAAKLLADRQKRVSDAMGVAQADLEEVARSMDLLSQQANQLASTGGRDVRAPQEQAD
jgi:prefoldin alpha subunit